MVNLLSVGFIKGSLVVILCIAIIYILIALLKILFGKKSLELFVSADKNQTEEEDYLFKNKSKAQDEKKDKEPISKKIIRFLLDDTPLKQNSSKDD